MTPMLRLPLMAGCVLIFVAGLASALGALPPFFARLALVLLAVHALELLIAQRFVRRHPGSLAASIALTLLFGALHWLPLVKASPSPSAGAPQP